MGGHHGTTGSAPRAARYHLHRQIAKGGMGRIHIARSIGAGGFTRIVAAKRLDPQLANDDEFVEMFLAEARVASRVRHRNVVPVLDVVTIDGEVVMVQELVHGAALHKLFTRAQLANAPIPVPVAVAIAAQILAGLHAAHEAVDDTGTPLDIVHRDVSPQNIMIAVDGTARLLDFGVAKMAGTSQVTRTGTFKGKLAYSSPEQLDGCATRQTDVYALGVVLWELLVGRRLYDNRSDAEVIAAIQKSTPPPLAHMLDPLLARRFAHVLDPVLARAFAHDPADRYATAADMEQALIAAVEPAPPATVAAWLRSLAQDMIDQTEQAIAAEEESWRIARGSGELPVIPSGPQLPRSSTSLETQGAKPSTLPQLIALDPATLPPRTSRRKRRMPPYRLPLVATALVILMLAGSLVAAVATKIQRPSAAPAGVLAAIAAGADDPEPSISHVAYERAPRAAAVPAPQKQPPRRRVVRRDAAHRECATPFFYVGTKKRFKPSCL